MNPIDGSLFAVACCPIWILSINDAEATLKDDATLKWSFDTTPLLPRPFNPNSWFGLPPVA